MKIFLLLIRAMIIAKASLLFSANFIQELLYSSHNYTKAGGHVLVYPSAVKNKGDYISVHEIASVPVWGNRWTKILCSNNDKSSTTFHEVLYFKPETERSLIEILKRVLLGMTPRTRIWCPTLLFHWPSQFFRWSATEEIQLTLADQVAPLANRSLEINLRFYFVFDILWTFGHTGFRNSVWELYFINGYDYSKGKLVIQEVPIVSEDDDNWIYGFIERRGDLRMTTLRVVAQNKDDTQAELTWKENDLVGGIAVEILMDFTDSLNFTFTAEESDWITKYPNGTLKGKTTELFRSKSIDLVIGQTVPIISRAEIMDYIQPTSKNMLRAYVHQPRASSSRNIYTTPFGCRLWLALLGACLLILISVRFTSKTLSSIQTRKPAIDTDNDDILTCDAFIWLIGSVTQQGWHKSPRAFSLRGIFITASITALVCYIAYAAQIVSVLSLEDVPIQSLDDLFKSSLPIYVITDSMTIAELMKELRGTLDANFHDVPKSIGVYFTFNFPSGILIYRHRFHEERLKQGFPDHLACSLIDSFPVTKVPLPSAMAMQKDAPLREIFNYKVHQMRERGYIARYLRKRISVTGLDCPAKNTHHRAELGIDDILTSILILLVGYGFCILFFICERIIFTFKRKRTMQMFDSMYYRK